MMIVTNNLLFVYGTLMRGHGNWRYYLADSIFLGDAMTQEEYALYASGIPFLAKDEQVCRIKGELYDIDDDTLFNVDGLEGHPYAYHREQIPVEIGGEVVSAWVYFYPAPRGYLIESGNFKDYETISYR